MKPSDRWAYGMSGMGYKASSGDMAGVPVRSEYTDGSRYKALKTW